MGSTPVDNCDGENTHCPKSEIVGNQVKTLFNYRNWLDSVAKNPIMFGGVSFFAAWQGAVLDSMACQPIRMAAMEAAKSGFHPDVYLREDEQTEKEYARLLWKLCDDFIKDGSFNQEKIVWTSSPAGEIYLKDRLREFARLEYRYHSRGMTRLKAMKELLKGLLMVITNSPIAGRWPFSREQDKFENYVIQVSSILLSLHQEKAFDFIEYSERVTGGKIGCSEYHIVKNSEMGSTRLRHYPVPKEVASNGIVLFLVPPLINLPDIFDLAKGKAVVEGLLNRGFEIYMVDYGEPGEGETKLGLDFYGKKALDHFFKIVKERHLAQKIHAVGYCMGGTILAPWLARRAEELKAEGQNMDIRKAIFMASPTVFDDDGSGHKAMRDVIRKFYDAGFMQSLFGWTNVPSQMIEAGMLMIQENVQYNVAMGFYGRATSAANVRDAAPFLYWLHHGTKFPITAHRQWINRVFLRNQISRGEYALPSRITALDGKAPDFSILKDVDLEVLNFCCSMDPIAPVGSCRADELGNGGSRKFILEAGHIFVVSSKFLNKFLETVTSFLHDCTISNLNLQNA